MTNIPLSNGYPVQIQNNYGLGFTLTNVGSSPAYLDNNSSVSPSTGQLLQPGVSVPVAANAVLWAVAASGADTTLSTLAGVGASLATITEISGPVNIGDVTLAPGSEVGISGPVAISSGTVDAILPPGTTVDINSGTVNVGNSVGQAALPVLLGTSPLLNYTTAVGNGIVTVGGYDVSAYSSILYVISNTGGPTTPVGTAYLTLQVTQVDGPSGTIFRDQQTAQYLLLDQTGTANSPYIMSLQVPVVASYATAGFSVAKLAAISASGTAYVSAFGIAKSIPSPIYVHSNSALAGSGAAGGAYTVSATAAPLDFISSRNGPAIASAAKFTNTVTGYVIVYMWENGVQKILFTIPISSGDALAASHQVNYPSPMRPIQVLTQIQSAGTIDTAVMQ